MKTASIYVRFIGVTSLLLCLVGCLMTQTSAHQDKTVRILMRTSMGDITAELYPEQAPKTVANFLRYVDGKLYDGGSFYRVVRPDNDNGSPPITVIQGDVEEGGVQFAPIGLETTAKTGLRHLDGMLSMARLGPDTATSSFFICIGAQPSLDAHGKRAKDRLGFAAFGRVVEGMEVVRAINAIRQSTATDNAYMKGQMLAKPVVISQIVRL